MNLKKLSRTLFIIGLITILFALLLPIGIYSGFYDYVVVPVHRLIQSYSFGFFGILSCIISYITFQIHKELTHLNKETAKQFEEYSLKFLKK